MATTQTSVRPMVFAVAELISVSMRGLLFISSRHPMLVGKRGCEAVASLLLHVPLPTSFLKSHDRGEQSEPKYA